MKIIYRPIIFVMCVLVLFGCSNTNETKIDNQTDNQQGNENIEDYQNEERYEYQDENWEKNKDEDIENYQNKEYYEDIGENQGENEDEDIEDYQYYEYSDIDDQYIKVNEQGIGFGGYSESVQTAYLKSDGFNETFIFSPVSADSLWLRLENNGQKEILITRAYVTVLDYQPVSYDDYIIKLAGAGDSFDSSLGLYAEVDSLEEEYLAYPAIHDEYGNINEIMKDPVIDLEIPANDGINIIYTVNFRKPGIYKYRANIEYEYNNSVNNIHIDSNILFDDLSASDYQSKIEESSHYNVYNDN